MAVSSQNHSKTQIANLPDELLLKIFSYLPQRKLIDTVGNVCLRWQHLSTDGLLWRSVRFSGSGEMKAGDEINLNEILVLLKQGLKLSELQLSQCTSREMKQVFENCVENQHLLYKISFESCVIHCDALRRFAIKSPGISFVNIGSHVQFKDASVLGEFKNIRNIFYKDPEHYSDLLVIARSCCNLTNIIIGCCVVTGEDFNKIVNNHPKLKTLYMDYLQIFQYHIFDDFRDNKSITELTIKCCYTGTEEEEDFVDYTPLTTLTNLRKLEIDFNSSKFSIGEMFRTMSKSITELNIGTIEHKKQPVDRDLLVLAGRIPNLKHLCLDCSRISDNGIYKYLLEAPKLQKLELKTECSEDSTNIVGTEWIPYIHKHPGLTELIIKECRLINDESLAILLSTCPYINITTSYTQENNNDIDNNELVILKNNDMDIENDDVACVANLFESEE